MDFSKIKQIVRGNGDKFIFVENGEPELVVMSFHEYEKLAVATSDKRHATSERSEPPPESQWPFSGHEGAPERAQVSVFDGEHGLPVRLEDIRLEDLPV